MIGQNILDLFVLVNYLLQSVVLIYFQSFSELFIADAWWVDGTPPSAGAAEIGVLLVATVQSDMSIKAELEVATDVDDLHEVICQAINCT